MLLLLVPCILRRHGTMALEACPPGVEAVATAGDKVRLASIKPFCLKLRLRLRLWLRSRLRLRLRLRLLLLPCISWRPGTMALEA